MRGKKGDVHVDWAISMGIFLVAVIAIFVIFKPGIKPIHKENVLLDIIEDEFRRNVTWTVNKLPIFIEGLGHLTNNNLGVHVNFRNSEWIISKCESSGNVGDLSINCDGSHSVVKCLSGVCKDIVEFIFYPNEANNWKQNDPEIVFPVCRYEDGEDASGDPNCNILLGSTESINGISPGWLNKLKQLGIDGKYNEVKNAWDYPPERDFAIYEVMPNGDENLVVGGDPFDQRNVFVREIKYWLLTSGMERHSSTISIRVW